jgi:hypothetical protein
MKKVKKVHQLFIVSFSCFIDPNELYHWVCFAKSESAAVVDAYNKNIFSWTSFLCVVQVITVDDLPVLL